MSAQSPRAARAFERYWVDDCPVHAQPSIVFAAARPPPRSGQFQGNTFGLYGRSAPVLNTHFRTFDSWDPTRKPIRKMPKSSSLSITTLPARTNKYKDGKSAQPLSPRSPQSPPLSGSRFNGNDAFTDDAFGETDQATPIAPFRPPDSPTSPRHRKDYSRNFFNNIKASKSSPRITTQPQDNSIRQVTDQNSSVHQVYPSGQAQSSSPELSGRFQDDSSQRNGASSTADGSDERSNSGSIKSTSVPHFNADMTASKRSTNKNKFQGILSRSRSIKVDESSSPRNIAPRAKLKANPPRRLAEPDSATFDTAGDSGNMKTAPLENQKSWRQNMNIGGLRTHSADRHNGGQSEDDRASNSHREQALSSSYNEPRGATFMSAIKTSSTKTANGFGKAGRAMLDRLHRSGSSTEKEIPIFTEENYKPKIISLPLVEQTRITRISKRLEDSKDKTEFWMPALPWRCIDYLNMKGCEEEGLYRIPGSGKDIKFWQQRFDKEKDINLFDEPELYDINIIGSMFKAWLRDLPDEIFPKEIQHKIADECQGAKSTPQMLKDELSKLPPYNYYLLFAITCHISLLHSCSESNKMDYRNLCICFQPCMKIEPFCFQFLVLDWRNCWQGCWTEKQHLAIELDFIKSAQLAQSAQSTQSQAPSSGARSLTTSTAAPSFMADDRSGAISSSASSKQSMTGMPERKRVTPHTSRDQGIDDDADDDDGATPTQAGHTRLAAHNLAAPAPTRLEVLPTSPFKVGFESK